MKLKFKHLRDIFRPFKFVLKEDKTLAEALWILNALDIQGLPVTNDRDFIVGYVSITDLWRQFPPTLNALQQKKISPITEDLLPTLKVGDIMRPYIISLDLDSTIDHTIEMFITKYTFDGQPRFLSSFPVISGETSVGFIHYTDILKHIETENTKIVDCLQSSPIITVHILDTLQKAYMHMRSLGLRSIVVSNDEKKPVGLLTDYHVSRHLQYSTEGERLFADLPVHDIMLSLHHITPLHPNHNINNATLLFIELPNARVFPVIHNNDLFGIISYIDILNKLRGV
jgi:predicted transcriptional regulator